MEEKKENVNAKKKKANVILVILLLAVIAVLGIIIYMLLHKTVQKNVGNKKLKIEEMPIGFYIGASNIILFFMMTFVTEYFI